MIFGRFGTDLTDLSKVMAFSSGYADNQSILTGCVYKEYSLYAMMGESASDNEELLYSMFDWFVVSCGNIKAHVEGITFSAEDMDSVLNAGVSEMLDDTFLRSLGSMYGKLGDITGSLFLIKSQSWDKDSTFLKDAPEIYSAFLDFIGISEKSSLAITERQNFCIPPDKLPCNCCISDINGYPFIILE